MAKQRKVAIIGNGNVGSALARAFKGAGHKVRAVGHEPGQVHEVASWGEVVVLAVPYGAIDDAVHEIGDAADGKVFVDVTNALTPDYKLATDGTTSGAEQLQQKVPHAKVVKAFNTVFAKNMETGKVKGEKISLFAAGDDETARNVVTGLGRDIGFDPVDAGPLVNARWLETLGYFNIQLGMGQKLGTDIGFKLVH